MPFVIIDFTDETCTEVSNVTGPFLTEEDADLWDEANGQRWGKHLIVPIFSPED